MKGIYGRGDENQQEGRKEAGDLRLRRGKLRIRPKKSRRLTAKEIKIKKQDVSR